MRERKLPRLVAADGLVWEYNGPDSDDHLAFGGHERGMWPLLQAFADADKDFVNIGAHVGTWALRVGAAELFNEVYAFEANPNTFDRLRKNIGHNGLQGHVIPVPAAVYSLDGERFGLVDANAKATGGSTRLSDHLSTLVSYDTVTLDTYFAAGGSLLVDHKGRNKVGLITIDVEGAEAHVLRGAETLIKMDKPVLIVELHDGHPGTDADLREQVLNLLSEYGYDYSSVEIGHGEYLVCQPGLEEFPGEVVSAGTTPEDIDALWPPVTLNLAEGHYEDYE